MNSDLLHGFELGNVHIDPLQGNVTSRFGSAHLPPKAMEVLLVLATHPGTLVTRTTLLEEVWGKGSGSQEALSHVVSEIRHALDDHADQPHYIQTLPKRGYRLLVEPVVSPDLTESIVIGGPGSTDLAKAGFLENLKQRGVLESAFAYLLLGWLLIQVADIVFAQLLLPPWAATFVTYLVISGFPIALILSWFLEFRDGKAILHELTPRDRIRRRFSRTYISVIGALALAAGLVFLYDQNVGLPAAKKASESINDLMPPVGENTIAVLPFLNVDGSPETDIFSNGLADDLITRLTRVPGLLVASRGDSFTLEPNSASRKVRDRLRVAFYLEGSVQIINDAMRVIVQLIDSETGFHVMSRTFDRPLEGYFSTRDAITELTVSNVRVLLPNEIQSLPVSLADESDLNAYVLYRKGKELFEMPRTSDSLQTIMNFYERALELDPHYAAALAGLCDVFIQRYLINNLSEDINSAKDACASALDANPQLYVVHSSLGDLNQRLGQNADAEAAYNRALEINSTDTQAMIGLSRIYRRQQKIQEAEQILHTAIAAQPGNWRTIHALAGHQFRVGRYEEAAEHYRQVLYLDPGNFEASGNLGSALTMAGDFEAGKLLYEEALKTQPTRGTYTNLGVIYYYLGEYQKSVAMHHEAVTLTPNYALGWTNLGDSLHFLDLSNESSDAYRQAASLAQKRLEQNAHDSDASFLLAWSEQMLGNSELAMAQLENVLPKVPDDPYSHYYAALIKNQAGDENAALEALAIALDKGYPAKMLIAEPLLANLRATDEFRRMTDTDN